MLDSITKKNIDNCRDILVGKVPDPKSQIEQITLALIYKFMDDMDREAVEVFKGNAKFFSGDYSKYSWRKLFDPSLSGKEMLDLYSDALEKLQTNPNIPELFRNIFKNAYLPYRDPATLKLFLKHIGEFEYSHSEKLGDAFEYLLSVMGSQGDAGQFRTPRHVIDFITACLNPQKHETVNDPACGTAGFLLSAYKHILNTNTDKRLGDKLTPDDRTKLAQNFVGYDISPDMVRLSLANMYLHGFSTPQVYEYDTLSSEDRWDETFDVILANPPFMTPKGGIRPHKKFGVQANKAEVLFTDYIAEHLNKNGRAGIVVPNGIVATTQTAYKQLRKMLVDDSLIAVISLPAGCFNPYSGVKTSILMLDKSLSKKNDHILFIKVENDGFDLGAQRREHDKNDLPLALEAFNAYKESLSSGKSFDEEKYSSICTLVEKDKIVTNKDIILNAERYFVNENSANQGFELCKVSDLIEFVRGVTYSKNDEVSEFGIEIFRANNISIDGSLNLEDIKLIDNKCKVKSSQKLYKNDILICTASGSEAHIGKVAFINKDLDSYFGGFMAVIRTKANLNSRYLFELLKIDKFRNHLKRQISSTNIRNLKSEVFETFDIPLPPLVLQEQIVKEIEGYQKIIDGAKMVVDNYKPTISIKPEWEIVELGKVFKLSSGNFLPTKNKVIGEHNVYGGNGINGTHNEYFLEEPTLVIGRVGEYCGAVHITTPKSWVTDNCLYVTNYLENLNQVYLKYALIHANLNQYAKVGGQPSVSQGSIYEVKIPLPPNEEQNEIVKRIEQEQQLVSSSKQLIAIFEQKIKVKINEVWGVKEEF
ncbi:N-6 DNA methylase [Flavobacterium sp.]|jgi:type I restriction enzyme M protein|uniref:N-6 DNA methylase n=1 Tax=Flavobacterium sp. TaxID=239 RepID=UPI0037BE2609